MTTLQGTTVPSSRAVLTPRALLVRGLIAGVVAGILAFAVGFFVGEPPIDDAIALEEAASASEEAGHSHSDAEEAGGHSHADEAEEDEGWAPSRDTQKSWGLLTATVVVGAALGGLVALFTAGIMGRLGRPGRRIRPVESAVLATAVGFVALALVPALKYPAAPPAVGSGDTIGHRTGVYFAFVLISIAAAALALYVGQRLWSQVSSYAGLVGGVLTFVVIVSVAAAVMPVVNELGDFPADILWSFRLSSILTLATLWGVIGIVFAGLLTKLTATDAAERARRDLAASL